MSRMPFFNSGLFDLVVDGTWALSDPDFMAASDKKIVLTLGSTLSHWHDIKGSIEVLNRLRPDLVAQLKALELIDPTNAYLDAIKSFAVEGRTSLSAQEFLDQGQRTLALTTALQKHAAEALGNNMNEIVGLMRPGQKHLADVMHALQTVHDDAASHTELIAKLSTAADALRDQGTELSEKVAVFKLHD